MIIKLLLKRYTYSPNLIANKSVDSDKQSELYIYGDLFYPQCQGIHPFSADGSTTKIKCMLYDADIRNIDRCFLRSKKRGRLCFDWIE